MNVNIQQTKDKKYLPDFYLALNEKKSIWFGTISTKLKNVKKDKNICQNKYQSKEKNNGIIKISYKLKLLSFFKH